MAAALDGFELEGISHNLPFLSAVMGHERFRSGRITTAFIAEEFPEGFSGVRPDASAVQNLAVIATLINHVVQQRAVQISGTIGNHRRVLGKDWVVTLEQAGAERLEEAVTLDTGPDGAASISFADGTRVSAATGWQPGQTLADFKIGGEAMSIKVGLIGTAIRPRWRGMDVTARVRSPRVAELARLMPVKLPPDTSKMLLCPMPGIVTSITVMVGERVEAGQTLATVEAMKMENILKAERQGVVKSVAAAAGQSLAVDELIIEFE
jgi:propionyl-CoA carboxylase alpha chain